jgi:hypothetical protein
MYTQTMNVKSIMVKKGLKIAFCIISIALVLVLHGQDLKKHKAS